MPTDDGWAARKSAIQKKFDETFKRNNRSARQTSAAQRLDRVGSATALDEALEEYKDVFTKELLDAASGLRLFPNLAPEDLAEELDEAKEAGIGPTTPGGPGFDDLITEGPIKWVVTEQGDLKVIPKSVPGVGEIPHTVASGGGPVLAAGEADISVADGKYFGTTITNHSGHYKPDEASLAVGRAAFEKAGITFP